MPVAGLSDECVSINNSINLIPRYDIGALSKQKVFGSRALIAQYVLLVTVPLAEIIVDYKVPMLAEIALGKAVLIVLKETETVLIVTEEGVGAKLSGTDDIVDVKLPVTVTIVVAAGLHALPVGKLGARNELVTLAVTTDDGTETLADGRLENEKGMLERMLDGAGMLDGKRMLDGNSGPLTDGKPDDGNAMLEEAPDAMTVPLVDGNPEEGNGTLVGMPLPLTETVVRTPLVLTDGKLNEGKPAVLESRVLMAEALKEGMSVEVGKTVMVDVTTSGQLVPVGAPDTRLL